ncbi:hypothetical protein B296_00034127 [Ensete ventricosum]|uniref:Uncharacterized protein n=1 Tax=Ensete ventricosum TaxID=4639 RepID=A0A426ZSL6_ENSVE|nr:hypothetical protein B296_00034127 [Ensete ventricosum]
MSITLCMTELCSTKGGVASKWSLPEIKDCLEEAGFGSIHVWIRKMPDTTDNQNSEEFTVSRDVKYEKVASFQQQDAWNAYIVSVANV